MTYVAENENYKLTIHHDELATSPREDYDNAGNLICWHNRYNIGDKHSYSDNEEFVRDLMYDVLNAGSEYFEDIYEEIDRIMGEHDPIEWLTNKGYAILPVYAHEHGGITISTGSFNDPWDSGQIGYIYMSPQELQKESFTVEHAYRHMEGEIEVYDQYLQGDVYYFELEKKTVCNECDSVEYEHVDSCGGFYGTDWDTNGLIEHVGSEHVELVNDLEWED